MIPTFYIASYGLGALALVYLTFIGFLQTVLIHCILPIYLISETLTIIREKREQDKEQVMKYWVAYMLGVFIERACDFVFPFMPTLLFTAYLLTKLGLFLWIVRSKYNFDLIYTVIDQLYSKTFGDFQVACNILKSINVDIWSYMDIAVTFISGYTSQLSGIAGSWIKTKAQ